MIIKQNPGGKGLCSVLSGVLISFSSQQCAILCRLLYSISQLLFQLSKLFKTWELCLWTNVILYSMDNVENKTPRCPWGVLARPKRGAPESTLPAIYTNIISLGRRNTITQRLLSLWQNLVGRPHFSKSCVHLYDFKASGPHFWTILSAGICVDKAQHSSICMWAYKLLKSHVGSDIMYTSPSARGFVVQHSKITEKNVYISIHPFFCSCLSTFWAAGVITTFIYGFKSVFRCPF